MKLLFNSENEKVKINFKNLITAKNVMYFGIEKLAGRVYSLSILTINVFALIRKFQKLKYKK